MAESKMSKEDVSHGGTEISGRLSGAEPENMGPMYGNNGNNGRAIASNGNIPELPVFSELPD